MDFRGKLMPKFVSSNQDALTEEQVKFYWEYGYIVVKKLFEQPLINLFRKRFVEIANMADASLHYSIVKDPLLRGQDVKPEMYINKIQELMYDDVYCQYIEDAALLRVVSQLIGSHLTAINCMLINKPPRTREHLPHQDMLYFPIRPADKIIACWTAMDPATIENGCLYMVPRSHKLEALYIHGEKSADKKVLFQSILREDIAAPLDKRVYLEMEPGDTVFFHPMIVHGSGANNSQYCRKAMTAHVMNSNCEFIDVRGTVQEEMGVAVETEFKKRGAELSFIDLWRVKCKQIQGTKCNL